MGINASYRLVNNNKGIDTNSIVHAFTRFFKKKGVALVNKQYLTVHQWESNHFLFGIGITPITCFDLEGWEDKKDWTLITFSSLPNSAKGWELELSETLKTKIECHGVYDTSNIYTSCLIENGLYLIETLDLNENSRCLEEINGEIRTSVQGTITIDCGGIEFRVPPDYYTLKTHSHCRLNIEGEQFLVFQENKETHFEKSSKEEQQGTEGEDIPF